MENNIIKIKEKKFNSFEEFKTFINDLSRLKYHFKSFELNEEKYKELNNINDFFSRKKNGKHIDLLCIDSFLHHYTKNNYFTDIVLKSPLFENNIFIYNYFYNDYNSELTLKENLINTLEELYDFYNLYIEKCKEIINVCEEDEKDEIIEMIEIKIKIVNGIEDFLKEIKNI